VAALKDAFIDTFPINYCAVGAVQVDELDLVRPFGRVDHGMDARNAIIVVDPQMAAGVGADLDYIAM
jgi:hypothetical protein